MSDRKSELAKKKAKLIAMRQGKQSLLLNAKSINDNDYVDNDAEQILQELGITNASSSMLTEETEQKNHLQSNHLVSDLKQDQIYSNHANQSKNIHYQLSKSQILQTDLLPSEDIIAASATYVKATQTILAEFGRDTDGRHSLSDYHVDSPRFLSALEWEDEFMHGDSPAAAEAAAAAAELTQLSINAVSQDLKQVQQQQLQQQQQQHMIELSEEEKQQILISDSFVEFFTKSSRIMERALAENDVAFDEFAVSYSAKHHKSYNSGIEDDNHDDDYDDDDKIEPLRLCRTFSDEKWSKNRCVTALHWSPHYQELCAAAQGSITTTTATAYTTHSSSNNFENQMDGTVCIWNVRFRSDSPEFALSCHSPLTSVNFAKFHRNLLIGGTQCGQLVLWDLRHHRRTPVMRSCLSAQGHTQPVVSLRVVGTEHANNLSCVSSDARLCNWTLDNLSLPIETQDLVMPGGKSLAITDAEFMQNDTNRLAVGTEDCKLGIAYRHGNRSGQIATIGNGHCGPVTKVSVHPNQELSNLLITSSFDWSVRIWSLTNSCELQSIAVFNLASDYVMHTQWSPLRAGQFCAADAAGCVQLWDLCLDSERPVAMQQMQHGINVCAFGCAASVLAAADVYGNVHICELSESLLSSHVSDEVSAVNAALVDCATCE